jgi:Tol biopolymer transport system component
MQDWSSDGRFILYRETDPKTYDLYAWELGAKKRIPVAATPSAERDGQFSHDARWVAYASDESGPFEIYAQPFPGPGSKVRISTGGGLQPRWRRDGKEIFYVAPDNTLMSVPVQFSGPDSMEPGAAVQLFRTNIINNPLFVPKPAYVVSPDGQRFLMIVFDDTAASSITMLLHWKPPKEN